MYYLMMQAMSANFYRTATHYRADTQTLPAVEAAETNPATDNTQTVPAVTVESRPANTRHSRWERFIEFWGRSFDPYAYDPAESGLYSDDIFI